MEYEYNKAKRVDTDQFDLERYCDSIISKTESQ